jgi:hypothetical protein
MCQAMTRQTRSRRRSFLFLLVSGSLLQPISCTLFDGGLLERTLTGALLDPFVIQSFELFFNLAQGGAAG